MSAARKAGEAARVDELRKITRALSRDLAKLEIGAPVTHVLDPLTYARAPHELYLEKFGGKGGRALFLGMNPGPWGMAQTGVPFGEIKSVRDWMGIEAKVKVPANEHPKRPVQGFACTRSEVSGRRLWSWAADRHGSAEKFFARFFVLNYCPLIFLEETGRNRTPDKLARAERDEIYERCDAALRAFVEVLEPTILIGVGGFAEARAKTALSESFPRLSIGRVLHPSPASPLANRGWAERAEKDLARLL